MQTHQRNLLDEDPRRAMQPPRYNHEHGVYVNGGCCGGDLQVTCSSSAAPKDPSGGQTLQELV